MARRGKKAVHNWPKLKEEYIDARLADPFYSLEDFAKARGIYPTTVRMQSTKQGWADEYLRRRRVVDERMMNETLERHGDVMLKLRQKLIFTEESLRDRAATFAGAIKGSIEASLIGFDWSQVSLKDRREWYALMHEIECSALGVAPMKHSVHHHVMHSALGPDGKTYHSPDQLEEKQQRRLRAVEKIVNIIEGDSVRVPAKKKAA